MQQRGFTLIELLTVVFIIGVLAVIVVMGFPEMKENLALKRAAHQLSQNLRRTQEMAMSSLSLQESENCSSPFPAAKGYGIYIDLLGLGNKNYKLYADTAGDTNISDCPTYEENQEPCFGYFTAADCVVKTIAIEEKGVVLKEIKNTIYPSNQAKISVNFKPPNPDVTIKWMQSDKNEVEIVLALENKPEKTKSVLVNQAGMIAIK